jgi:hypothetical protein
MNNNGLLQGDPLASMLFALVIHKIILKAAAGKINEARTFRSALLQYSGEFLKALPIPGCHSRPNDVYGLHASNCRTTARHERLKHLLKSIAVEANLSAITEPIGLLPNSDDRVQTSRYSHSRIPTRTRSRNRRQYHRTERTITIWLDVKLSISISSLLSLTRSEEFTQTQQN